MFEAGWSLGGVTNSPQIILPSILPVAESIKTLSSKPNHPSEFNEGQVNDSPVSRDPVNESKYPQILSHEDDTVHVSLSLQFPLSVSRAILDNVSVLELHVEPLAGVCYFEAGYDIIPDQCELGFPEQASFFSCIYSRISHAHFLGSREMLWIVRAPNDHAICIKQLCI